MGFLKNFKKEWKLGEEDIEERNNKLLKKK